MTSIPFVNAERVPTASEFRAFIAVENTLAFIANAARVTGRKAIRSNAAVSPESEAIASFARDTERLRTVNRYSSSASIADALKT